jgi:tetratricopeptide (TPR) repeat protein
VLEPGDRLERWLVEDRFAGGWGIVYVLRDDEPLDSARERVAAKTIRPEFAADRARVDQFDRECYAWLSLGSHKHIVRLFTVDRFHGQAFALGEYVPPGLLPNTLRRWLDAGLLELEAALRFAVHMCRAIDHARSHGLLVHHDLKPENVMITPAGVAKVTDWGLSRVEAADGDRPAVLGEVPYRYAGGTHSATAQVHGTRGYAAPECYGADAEPTALADMFSLGVCVVEMIDGSRPQPDTTAAAIAGALAPLCGEAASRLADELARCLSSRPAERPASTGALQAAMAEAFHDLVRVPIESQPPETPESPSDLGQQAYALFMLGKLDEAMEVQKRVEGDDDRTGVVVMDYKEAGWKPVVPQHYVAAAEDELSAHPEDRDRLESALHANELAGNLDRALELCHRWLDRQPDDVSMLKTAAGLARQAGDSQAALAFLDCAIDVRPADAALWLERAVLLEDDGNAADALASAARAVELEPRNVDALIRHGHLLRQNGDSEAAVRDFRTATKKDPANELAWFNLGTCQNDLGRHAEAFASFSRAAELGSPLAFNSLGGLAASAGAADHAISYFEQAIAADPRYARPWFNLGQVREQLGQYDKARDAYEHAVAIDSGYELAQEGVRRIAARRGW